MTARDAAFIARRVVVAGRRARAATTTMEEETMEEKVLRFMAVVIEVRLTVNRTEEAERVTVLIDMAVSKMSTIIGPLWGLLKGV